MKKILYLVTLVLLSYALFACESVHTNNLLFPRSIYYQDTFTMNANPTQSLIIPLEANAITIGELVFLDEAWLTKELITHGQNYLMIDSSAFIGKTGTLTVDIQTNQGIISLAITINESSTPHFISKTSLNYKNRSIILFFEPLEGVFVSLNGNTIQAEDYFLEGNKLTIKATFIDRLIDENPLRSKIILSYNFRKEMSTTIGYISISLPIQES